MAHEQEDSCVYVKEAVLHELEQERRNLKWELCRALQTSDAREAQLTACQAKVKDLLTIVEVNKGVADQVLQRSHSRDTRQKAEIEAMRKQNARQHQRYVAMVVNLMSQRIRDRKQRGAFHALLRSAVHQRQLRRVLQRLQTATRQKYLRRGLDNWQRFLRLSYHASADNCRTGCSKIHPVSGCQPPSKSPALLSNDQLAALKVPCKYVDRAHKGILRRFSRWRLLRSVWRCWERIVRRRRNERKLVDTISGRLLRSKFAAWRLQGNIHRQRKVLLRRLIAKKSRRLQLLGFVSFRLRCSQTAAFEWAEVLKAAHTAMEEERALRSQVQSSTASEMHNTYQREQHRQQQLLELQMQRLEKFKRRECKRRVLILLRCEVKCCHQRRIIVLDFQRRRHLQLMIGKVFACWKRGSELSRRIKNAVMISKHRRAYATKTHFFKAIVRVLRRNRQLRLRLRALLIKRRRSSLFMGWLRLRIQSAIAERNAVAHVEVWQVKQHAKVAQVACQDDVKRARKITIKYQITCALLMADRKHENCLRRLFNCWSRCMQAKNCQRRAVNELVRRWRLKVLETSFQVWNLHGEELIERRNQLCRFESIRRHRSIRAYFGGWRRYAYKRAQMKMSRHLQRVYFHAWRHCYISKQQKVRWFIRFQMRILQKRKQTAFRHWKRSHGNAVMSESRREAADHELIVRIWRRWIGFHVYRLYKQRYQQQKALSGVRRSLQLTVLSSIFVSWQAQWRQQLSRREALVRALRGIAARVLIRKTLQAWHELSAILSRRRTSLDRIIRRRMLNVLQRRWHTWTRAALRQTVAHLETSSVKARRQVHGLVRKAMRFTTLHRALQGWRVISASHRQQQRRREMYVEKRRYEAVQATFRHWLREITKFPLTKQQRLLQRQANRLRISLERRAFSLWCRWAQRNTLVERDMISAELFRRSERRHAAIAAEMCADKERRLVFVAWKTIVEHKRAVLNRVHENLENHHFRLLRIAWGGWATYTNHQRCVERLGAILTARLKATAWSKLVSIQRAHSLKSHGAQWAIAIWQRILLRHAWHHWKVVHHEAWKEAVLSEAIASAVALTIAFKMTIAIRHHRQHSKARFFLTWRKHTSCTKHLCHRLRNILKRQVQTTVEFHFQKWRKCAEHHNRFQQIMLNITRRQHLREVRLTLIQWRTWILEKRHWQQLEQTKRVMVYNREASAKIVAAAKFLSWQRPCLEVHFVRWKVHIEQRHRYISEKTVAYAQRRTRRLLRSVWQNWSVTIHHGKRRTHLLTVALNKMILAHIAYGFDRWAQWMHWRHTIDESLARLSRIRCVWRYRRGITALRQNQHEAIRRQSVMAATAFAAYNTRQRGRQAQLMRGVALFLQRKTSTALCARYFRQWMLYVKNRAKIVLTVQMTRLRSLKRVTRRYLIEWHLASRQKIVLRQIIHRRLEARVHRRLRRVWNMWTFYTKHSQDMKHLVYDRLITCALQDILHGAWVQWKAHTRYANSLLDAQRLMQWEEAAGHRDQQLTALEEKHERALLRAAQLGQLNNTLRYRQVASATKRLLYMLNVQHKAWVMAAFGFWRHKLTQIRVLQMRMTAVIAQHLRLALRTWHRVAAQLRIAADIERVESDAGERTANVAYICGKLWLRRRTFTAWQDITRTRRKVSRRIAAAEQRQNQRLVQFCWGSWRSIFALRERQEVAIEVVQARKTVKALVRTFCQWRGFYRQSRVAKHNAVKTFLLVRRDWERRVALCFWSRWRNFTMDISSVLLHAKLMVAELELRQAANQLLKRLLRSIFTSWKVRALSQSGRRKVCAYMHAVVCRGRLLRRYFSYWKANGALRRKRIVLAGRLLRHLRRHHAFLARFSFWSWFARVHVASPLLPRTSSVHLQLACKRLSPTTDAPAAIARALLIDLLVAQRELIRSQQRSAWRLMNATARSAHRLWLQIAFQRLADGIAVRRLLAQTDAATCDKTAGRVFVHRMTKLLLRSGFQRWKAQYVAQAIREAEETQEELLHALRHISSYRHTLDPYTSSRRFY